MNADPQIDSTTHLGRDKGKILRRNDLVRVDVVLHDEALAGVFGRPVSVLRHLFHTGVFYVGCCC